LGRKHRRDDEQQGKSDAEWPGKCGEQYPSDKKFMDSLAAGGVD
jgi:hypothetical protein